MRLDSTLNVTPEGSLDNLPDVVEDTEDSRRGQRIQQAPEIRGIYSPPNVDMTRGIPSTTVKTVPGHELDTQGINQEESSKQV